MGRSPTVIFVDDAKSVLVTLCYDAEGKPMVVAAGKKKERERDVELIVEWLRAEAAQTVGYQGPG